MRAIKSRDTTPEKIVRKIVHGQGYRYRLHRKDLPGKPDLVFGPLRKVIFVHGCFWHSHHCKRGNRRPKTNKKYWDHKLDKNIERDAANKIKLSALDWEVFVVWECEIKDEKKIISRITRFLDSHRK